MQASVVYNFEGNSGHVIIKDIKNNTIFREIDFELTPENEPLSLGTTLSGASNIPVALAKGTVDLAAYLYALSTAGELPDNKLISELVLCNSSVNQARKNLSNGSMNVISDLIKRPQLTGELTYLRNKKYDGEDPDNMPCIYVSSSFVSSGLCREHSVHVSIIHSQKTQADDTVTHINSDKENHCWTETKKIVMDSWAYGPAILKEDAVFTAKKEDKRTEISKKLGHSFLQWADVTLAKLNDDPQERQKVNDCIKNLTKTVEFELWPETSAVNGRLKEHIITKRRATSHTQLRGINSQIRAVGVLRNLARARGDEVSIKDAISSGDKLLDAFNGRYMKDYLGQRESE